MSNKIIFHGGCVTCIRQLYNGVKFCNRCRYHNAEWDKPDLSIRNEINNNNLKQIIIDDTEYDTKIKYSRSIVLNLGGMVK